MSEDGKVATPWTDKTKAQVQQVRGGGRGRTARWEGRGVNKGPSSQGE